jgi:hypothetical protein
MKCGRKTGSLENGLSAKVLITYSFSETLVFSYSLGQTTLVKLQGLGYERKVFSCLSVLQKRCNFQTLSMVLGKNK